MIDVSELEGFSLLMLMIEICIDTERWYWWYCVDVDYGASNLALYVALLMDSSAGIAWEILLYMLGRWFGQCCGCWKFRYWSLILTNLANWDLLWSGFVVSSEVQLPHAGSFDWLRSLCKRRGITVLAFLWFSLWLHFRSRYLIFHLARLLFLKTFALVDFFVLFTSMFPGSDGGC